jgi:hypothetical protein
MNLSPTQAARARVRAYLDAETAARRSTRATTDTCAIAYADRGDYTRAYPLRLSDLRALLDESGPTS